MAAGTQRACCSALSQSRQVASGSVCACERANMCISWGSLTGWPLDPGSPWFPGRPVPPSVPRLPGGPSCPGNPLSPFRKQTKVSSQRGKWFQVVPGEGKGEPRRQHRDSTGSVETSEWWGPPVAGPQNSSLLKRKVSLFTLASPPLSTRPLLFIVPSQQTMQFPPAHLHSHRSSCLKTTSLFSFKPALGQGHLSPCLLSSLPN